MDLEQLGKSGLFYAVLIVILGTIGAGIVTYFVLVGDEIEPVKKLDLDTRKISTKLENSTSTAIVVSTTSCKILILREKLFFRMMC